MIVGEYPFQREPSEILDNTGLKSDQAFLKFDQALDFCFFVSDLLGIMLILHQTAEAGVLAGKFSTLQRMLPVPKQAFIIKPYLEAKYYNAIFGGDMDGRVEENSIAFKRNAVETTLRVRYAETDQMQMVHHANYLVWFECARSEFCRQRGIDYGQMERDGLILPLMEAHCRYLRPARYDDEITLRVWVVELRRSLLRLQYEVRRGDELLATGETLQMLLDRDTHKLRRFPPELAARFHSEYSEFKNEENREG